MAFDLTGAVAETGGQTDHPVAIDHPIGDQTHGSCDDIGPFIPLR